MSLVASYAYGDDGFWHRDPTFGKEGEWFVCYDDDDPIELVVFEGNVNEIIKDLPFRITGKASRSERLSPPSYRRGKLAQSYWLEATGPFPKDLLFNKTRAKYISQEVQRMSSGVFHGAEFDKNWRLDNV